MFRPVRQKNSSVSALYFVLAVALVAVAVPRLHGLTYGLGVVFQFSWLVFAMTVIAANLWFALSISKRRKIAGPRQKLGMWQHLPEREGRKQTRRRGNPDV